MNIERILLATDCSPEAEGAEVYASMMAELWGADLTVVNVLEFAPGLNPEYPVNRLYLTEMMKSATRTLAELKVRAEGRGISVQTQIATGIPSQEVLGAAEAHDVDLVVVGTLGKTGLKHVLLGSTAERVIRASPCPVLVVRDEWSKGGQVGSGPRPAALDRILVPVDFSDCSLDALEYAAVVARRAKASLTLLHVLEPVSYGLDFTLTIPGSRERKKEAAAERLAGVVAALKNANVSSDYVLRGGLPNDSILEAAKTSSADMIVMGTHGRRGLSHALYGSVAEFVLRNSRCPVLTVRNPKFKSGHRRVLEAPSPKQ
ncbi:MAG: universal stress protein [Nitrospira sp.]|nr:universal stress protein [Nitrospira sp.]